MNVTDLVDAFVEKVNTSPREPEQIADVPEFLRQGEIDGDFTDWRIVRRDNITSIRALQNRLGLRFPASFLNLVSRYSFPAFEFGPVMFFANTGQNIFWELGSKLFKDPFMSPVLRENGYIQIGNPYFYNYDPICFNSNATAEEYPIVQLDHEAILQLKQLLVVEEIAPSFSDLMTSLIQKTDE
jgi:hypothetical protein